MIVPVEAARKRVKMENYSGDIWFTMFNMMSQIKPLKVVAISKKFIYFEGFDPNGTKEQKNLKFAVWKIDDRMTLERHGGIFDSEIAALRFYFQRVQKHIDFASKVIDDYRNIINNHPEATI